MQPGPATNSKVVAEPASALAPSADADARYREGLELLAARRFQAAIAAFRAALVAAPDLALARLKLASTLVAIGERDAAMAESRLLETFVPLDAASWREAFDLLRKLHDPTRAQLVTHHFIAETGGNADARLELVESQIHPQLKGIERIEAGLADAIAHAEETVAFWRRVADLRRKIGHLVAAVAAIDRALRIDPTDFTARCVQIELMVREDRFRKARRLLAELPPFVPAEDARGWLRVAEIAIETHDRDMAKRAIGSVQALLPPKDADTRFGLVKVLLAMKDLSLAEAIAREVLVISNDVFLTRRIFDLAYDAGQNALALDAGRKLDTLAPVYDVTIRMQGLEFAAEKARCGPGAPPASAPARGSPSGWLGWLLGR